MIQAPYFRADWEAGPIKTGWAVLSHSTCTIAHTTLMLASLAVAVAQFGPAVQITSATGICFEITARDIDTDGHLDVVATSPLNERVHFYRGLGGGAFAPAQTLDLGATFPSGVVCSDTDADGDLDLLVISAEVGSLFRIENLGGGQLGDPAAVAPLPSTGLRMDAADLDADGDADVVTCNLDAPLQFIRNNGPSWDLVGDLLPGTEAFTVKLADLDGDGDPDVVFGGHSPDRLAWAENVGGQFMGETVIGSSLNTPRDIAPADVDGDGDIDLAIALEWDHQIGLYENLGGGAFGPLIVIDGALQRPSAVAVADFDGDGSLDVLGADQDQVVWYPNLGGLGFGPARVVDGPAPGRRIALGDVDGDGDADVVSSPYNVGLRWIENDGQGDVQGIHQLSLSAANVQEVVLSDADADGDLDGFSVSLDDDRVAFYENIGGGQFGSQVTLGTEADGAMGLWTADIDGDGLTDVVAASRNDMTVRWYRRDAQGTYGAGQTLYTHPTFISSAHVDDLDGDGDPDLIVAGLFQNAPIVWLANDGSGLLGPPIQLAPSGRIINKIVVDDLDLDGVVDIAMLNGHLSNIFVFRGLGGGSYGSAQGVTTFLSLPGDFLAVDMDSDGLKDIVVGGFAETIWMKNLGGMNFGQLQFIVAGFSTELAALDLDGDGDVDLATASKFDPGHWIENLGQGAFAHRGQITPMFDGYNAPVTGDVDGDGDVDLVVCDSFGGRVFLFPNSLYGEVGQSYCGPAVPNASGAAAELRVFGSPSASSEALSLVVQEVPRNAFGLFFTGRSQGLVTPPGSIGRLCMSGSIGRYIGPGQILSGGPSGIFSLTINPAQLATPNGFTPALPGETWNFQAWFRDSNGGPTSNFSQAVSLTWN